MSAAPAITAVVPTLGTSPYLRRCLEALGGPAAGVRRYVVLQGGITAAADWAPFAERVIEAPARLGFSAATNLGLSAALAAPAAEHGEWVATVNDDAIVEPGWAEALRGALERDPRAASAQGVNLRLHDPDRVDGWGLGWNRRWQAAQLGAGQAPPPHDDPPREVFGVSATAALYRRSALQAIARPHGVFDERLDSFYEDVELAGALRTAGFTAWTVPAARAHHAGSTTAGTWAGRRAAWIYGNRFLVLADLLGDGFPGALPRALRADLVDAARALARPRVLGGILRGWSRAARGLSGWRREGPPRISLGELRRLEAPVP